jgi:SAM-dependent methyltransferase
MDIAISNPEAELNGSRAAMKERTRSRPDEECDMMSAADPSLQQAFTDIYRQSAWNKLDETVRSGEGSAPELNKGYISLLQRFIRERGIRAAVDVGCGDWSFSRLIDWSGVNYIGVDIVPEVVETLRARYARPSVCFELGDFVTCDLPPADLIIAKDALQHLPTELVKKFLTRLPRFNYAILTNDRRRLEPRAWRNLWLPVESEVVNSDIRPGGYRPLRLREPPFNLKAVELMQLRMHHTNGLHTKEVLLWENPDRGR